MDFRVSEIGIQIEYQLLPLRGGGPEDGDANAALFDCGPNTQTQKVANGRWVCWEWMFDGQKNQLRLYLDGVEQMVGVFINTVPVRAEKRIPKITVLSVASLFGEAIKRIHTGESVSSLFV